MQILNDLLVSLDNPEIVNPIKMDWACRLYKYDLSPTPNPEYGVEVFVNGYRWTQEMQDFFPYKDPMVVSWTVKMSDFSHRNPDIYGIDAKQHEAIHHMPKVELLNDHLMQELFTQEIDAELQNANINYSSVPITTIKMEYSLTSNYNHSHNTSQYNM
jgi:hypothetical protein